MTAVLTYQRKDLVDRMVRQLAGSERFLVFFNGGNPDRETLRSIIAASGEAYITEKNRGVSGGWNDLMDYAQRRWPGTDAIWMCTDDTLRISAAMGRDLYALLQEHPEAGGVAPADPTCHFRAMKPRESGRWHYVDHLDSAAGMMRVSTWNDIGPFDEQFFGWGMDYDWAHRAGLKGYKFIVDDESWIINDWTHGQMQGSPDLPLADYGDWKGQLLEKWGEPMRERMRKGYEDV